MNQQLGVIVPMEADSPSAAVILEEATNRDKKPPWKINEALTTSTTPSSVPSPRAEAMPTGSRRSLIGDLTALKAQLDGLCADQSSEDLSRILRSAFTERGLYKLYITFLAADEKRAKALLEVFDKVCTGNVCHSVKCFSILSYNTGTCDPRI